MPGEVCTQKMAVLSEMFSEKVGFMGSLLWLAVFEPQNALRQSPDQIYHQAVGKWDASHGVEEARVPNPSLTGI